MGKVHLTPKEQRQLQDLVRDASEEIEAGRWTQAEFARIAEKAVGRLGLNAGHVARAAEVMEVHWPKGGLSVLKQAQLAARQRVLARNLVHMIGRLGETVSPELKAIAEEGNNGK